MAEIILLKSAFMLEIHMDQKGGKTWATFIRKILKTINCSNVLDSGGPNKSLLPEILSRVAKHFSGGYFKHSVDRLGG